MSNSCGRPAFARTLIVFRLYRQIFHIPFEKNGRLKGKNPLKHATHCMCPTLAKGWGQCWWRWKALEILKLDDLHLNLIFLTYLSQPVRRFRPRILVCLRCENWWFSPRIWQLQHPKTLDISIWLLLIKHRKLMLLANQKSIDPCDYLRPLLS